jgi:hypothetical protein
MTARDGPLACERIVGVLEKMMAMRMGGSPISLKDQIAARSLAQGRRLAVNLRKYISNKHAPQEFHQHRYPGISIEELKKRILHFQKILGHNPPIEVTQIFKHIFRIRAA